MDICSLCGQQNQAGSNFCRSCGSRVVKPAPVPQSSPASATVPTHRAAYGWKTDEFPEQGFQHDRGRTNVLLPPMSEPLNGPNGFAGPVGLMNPIGMALPDTGYRCPHCGTDQQPITERKTSTAGWIVFSLLLLFTFIFFWVGLLMKEDVVSCPMCRLRLN
jgi:DNA-directed RNA polymerase subunit RPC12/RpoP